MIKHGKVHKLYGKSTGGNHSHLEPIREFITKGIADASEKVVIHPLACDVKGAKRYDGQQCVIARALTRTMHPQAVAVGRSLAFVVFKGLAIRFRVPAASKKLVEGFDQRGRVRNAPVELCAINPAWSLHKQQSKRKPRVHTAKQPRRRMKRYGVRAIGGGIAA